MNQINIPVFESFVISATLVLTWRQKKNDRSVVFQIIKVLLRRKFLFLFPSFFNINLLYRFKIIQIAKNWNDTCVRGLEISH